ncbi:hypothetical protein Taro_014238 [Colocasia esculenta]|uniref:SANT domain-containing protein n=1 Tax=Colocasia esculenta TaxID=4460 RepID=A0A843U8J3_COLES|nr:hypothetical protein [Colocasia esculenta]
MPPEPSPWDRRDFIFREKKHERGSPYHDALGGGGSSSLARWRETCHGSREFPTPSPRRPPSGYYRHGGGGGGYQSLFPDELCSRSEDDGFRTYQSGRYGGSSNRTINNRENGGYFRRSSWDSGDFPRQHHDLVASQRSVADPLSHPSPHLTPFEDQHDKTSGGVDDGSRTGHKHDRDPDHSLGSLQWKPLKWNRTGSFSSSSKAVRSEPEEGRLEVVVPPGKETPVESPVASPVPSDEGLSRKKQRLGWGQGLAKYEKEKIVVTDDGGRKSSSARASPSDTSPKLMALPGSASPATPSSMGCSSSRGEEDKYFCQIGNTDASTYLSDSPCHDSIHFLENFSITSENLDLSALSQISSLLTDLLHMEDACSAGSNFMHRTAVSKLMLLKRTVLKQLEKTETEIDSFENELKKLNFKCERSELQMSLKVDSESERSDPCQRSLKLPIDHLSSSSGGQASVVNKASSHSESLLASAVIPSVGNGHMEVLLGEANEHGDFSPDDVDSESLYSSSREKETSHSDSPKAAVLEAGAMSDTDQPLPSVMGNGPVDGALDVRTSGDVVCLALNFGQEFRNLTASVMAANRESAKRASEILDISFQSNCFSSKAVYSCDSVLDKQNESHIRNKLAMHKYLLRFKERALTLKFRVFQRLWREDLHLLSIRKHRSKSQKKFELNCRSSQNGSHKNRSSLRSRVALSGNSTLIPTLEILDFTSKLLSDSQIKLYRNNLRMPQLMLEEREKKHGRFISNNGLIEDPCSFEKERSFINPWSAEEREIFMEKLALYGKDFSKIASFFSHKTTADCIEFYYKNHKSETFEKVKRSLGLKKNRLALPSSSYLLSSSNKWKPEANAASLDVLGTASMIALQADDNMSVQHKFSGRSTFGSHHDVKISRGTCATFEMSNNADVLGQEQETSAADVLMGICGALSSEAMSSCVTTSFDHGEKMNYMACDRHLASEVTQIVDEDTCSDEGCGEVDSVDWTDEEKSTFISALSSYGRDFMRIAHYVGTRSEEQCKIFFSKARKSLGLDAILRGTLSDANIGKSDTEDACMFEIDSAMCSTQSYSKMEVDFTHSTANDSSAVSGQAEEVHPQIDPEACSEQCKFDLSSQEKIKSKMEELISSSNGDGILLPEEENLCSKLEGKALKVDFSSNTSKQLNESAERHSDIEMEKDGNVPAESPGGYVSRDEFAQVDRMDSCDSTEPQLTVVEKDTTGNSFRAECEEKKILLPENEPDDKQLSQTCLQVESMTRSPLLVPETNKKDTDRLPDDKVNACHQVVFSSSYKHQMDLPSLDKRPQFISQEQKVNPTPSTSTLPLQTLPVRYEDLRQAKAFRRSSFSFEDHGNKQQKISAPNDIYEQYLSGEPSFGNSSAVLRGYPLQVLNKGDMNGQAQSVGERSVFLHNCPSNSGVPQSEPLLQDSQGQNSSSSHYARIPFLPEDTQHAGSQLRPCLQSSSNDREEPSVRTGDVKLFGQILSNPSAAQKPSPPANCDKPKPLVAGQASSLNLLNGHSDGALSLQRAERSHHQGRQELPGRDYRVWGSDGGVLQRGVSAVPDSGMFLAKYPGSSLSCFAVKDQNGSCGFVKQAYLQPITLDENRGDISFDLQKHNGFETVSGFQHQGRVSLGMVAGSSILVGSKGCTGVSDPVAALKMHYARTGVLQSEEESWRSDIGRR